MLRWVDENDGTHHNIVQRYWDRFVGVTGPDDAVVSYEQSDLMYAALRRANKQVDLVTLKHEDHWLSRSETRLQMLQAMVEFLRANNPPE
jgi:esterase/lipase